MSTTNIILVLVIVVLGWLIFKNGKQQKQAAAGNRIEAAEFLAQNGQKSGVTTTDSGLQYEVLNKGDGTEHPSATDKVTVHYHGTLLDGSVFDSSVVRGESISFGLNQVIPGWTEGVQLMTVGDKFRFFIGPDLGYGDRAAGKIAPGSLLIFEVELLAIAGK
ncbi:peptidylprolyl isomerase [Pseudoalteromonas rubra]|uniref:Peptidyl-prolyl cis-trans isomerase n=1 Tax=Pseudoalteromonas rubra TaxID=43658 RepID=A0A5S3WHJ6_9GAMM|nr:MULTISPECIES: FKBP-type peptidyl-prolyl cis-trans isomerase [Pseudoalteromonas]MCF2910625.1 FKBP-type peptidyl-prolyl cis-trans isomerase [Pseudoalteromonas sp. DL2-H2.2]TMP25583.1 peptidylprolyl isomerase [Pseudoalteromonas rubra]TMP31004.1 peptidylprolyl isomerase [Pseudoalteromonas rubra]